MSNLLRPTALLPWYRQLWPWLLLSLPLAALIAGLFTFWLAAHTANPLVVDDYYREGKAINQSLARTERAAALQWQADLFFTESQSTSPLLALSLHSPLANPATVWPNQLALHLIHPTQVQHDQRLLLQHMGAGQYQARWTDTSQSLQELLTATANTHWKIQLEDIQKTWRMQHLMPIIEQQKLVKIVITP